MAVFWIPSSAWASPWRARFVSFGIVTGTGPNSVATVNTPISNYENWYGLTEIYTVRPPSLRRENIFFGKILSRPTRGFLNPWNPTEKILLSLARVNASTSLHAKVEIMKDIDKYVIDSLNIDPGTLSNVSTCVYRWHRQCAHTHSIATTGLRSLRKQIPLYSL